MIDAAEEEKEGTDEKKDDSANSKSRKTSTTGKHNCAPLGCHSVW
jgi:hypothetical protein